EVEEHGVVELRRPRTDLATVPLHLPMREAGPRRTGEHGDVGALRGEVGGGPPAERSRPARDDQLHAATRVHVTSTFCIRYEGAGRADRKPAMNVDARVSIATSITSRRAGSMRAPSSTP